MAKRVGGGLLLLSFGLDNDATSSDQKAGEVRGETAFYANTKSIRRE
jgi:hypothetical protein